MSRTGMPEWRRWAWGLLLVGGGVSIAVNLGHAYLPPPGADPAWSPSRWSIAWAVIVPTLLFFAVKGITVIPWPPGFKWVMWRWFAALPVAGLAGFVSWAHINGLLTSIGEDRLVGTLAPLAVDGLMLIGVGGLLIPISASHRMPTVAPVTAPPVSPAVAPGRLLNGAGAGTVYGPTRRR